MGFSMSDWGQDWARAKIKAAYNATPDAEKRDSPWAKRYLQLAYFCGYIRGDDMQAIEMYKEFLGIQVNPATKKDFFASKKLYGMCSEDGKTGWGPMQENAADAFFQYIELYDVKNSAQYTQDRCLEYYYLLYDFDKKQSDDHSPHPKFNKYWQKILILARKHPQPIPSAIKQNAPDAAPFGPGDE